MAHHHVYHTPAIVIATYNTGEADRVLELFTRGFGRMNVVARGVRREHAKLRYVVQAGAWIEANLVRGSGGWRLTTAVPLEGFHHLTEKERSTKRRLLLVLKRILPYEVAVQELFDDYARAFQLFDALHEKHAPREIETLLLVRVLAGLGYWGKTIPPTLRHHGSWTEEMLQYGHAHHKTLVSDVNNIFASLQS